MEPRELPDRSGPQQPGDATQPTPVLHACADGVARGAGPPNPIRLSFADLAACEWLNIPAWLYDGERLRQV